MVGLVYIDRLYLTPVQWTALGLNAAAWVWCFRHPQRWMLTAALAFAGLWVAFWNATTSVDQWLLFEQARYLSQFGWHEFLEALARRPYVKKQPPFLTFWISRMPVLWLHQLVWFPFALLCVQLMWRVYGQHAALLAATPVFALMIHQPSHDLLLFGMLLIVLQLQQLVRSGRSRLLTAFVYGLTWMIKPLTLLTAPFLLPQLGIFGLGSLAMWGGYLLWAQQWEFGRHQMRFLLHQVLLKPMETSKGGETIQGAPRPLADMLRELAGYLWHTLDWRWQHVGRKAVRALPFYLFPTYLRLWTWRGIGLTALILFGFGNIKYLLLNLLFLFPVRDEE